MKRKDWKTKKLKRNIFGKSIFKSSNCYFLRKLKIRKSNILIRKNLEPHYIFYKNVINNFNSKKFFYLNNFILTNYNNNIISFPGFFIKKKVFNDFYNYIFFLKKYNLNYIFLKKKYNLNNIKGLNFFLFNNFYGDKNNLFLKNLSNDIEKLNDRDVIVLKKLVYEIKNFDENIKNINFHFNFNIYFINIIEIYKILIYLHVFKIIK